MQVDLENMIDEVRLEKAYKEYLRTDRMVDIGEYYFPLLVSAGKIKAKNPHLVQQARDIIQQENDAIPSEIKIAVPPTAELAIPNTKYKASQGKLFSYVKRLAVEEMFEMLKKQNKKTVF